MKQRSPDLTENYAPTSRRHRPACSSVPSTGSSPKSKRAKSNQACSSCRKLKTRCELLELSDSGHVKCHRCKVLNLRCSFLEMENPPIPSIPSPSTTTQPTTQPLIQTHIPDGLVSPSGPALGLNGFPRVELGAVQFWTRLFPHASEDLDWSAPVRAFQKLPHHRPDAQPQSMKFSNALHTLISQDLKAHLLEIFDSQYTSWTIIPILRRRGPMPLVELAKCSIASRHLKTSAADAIRAGLYALVARFVANVSLAISQFESIDACLALGLLAVWRPLQGNGEEVLADSRGILSLAEAIARNLRLDQTSNIALRCKPSPITGDGIHWSPSDLSEIWLWITVIDSSVSVGSGRLPVARRSLADIQVMRQQEGISSQSDTLLGQLGTLIKLLDATENGVSLQLPSLEGADVDSWAKAIDSVTETLDTISEIRQESFCIVLRYYLCRIVVLYQAIFEARYHCQEHGLENCTDDIRPLLTRWSSQILSSARSFLSLIDSVHAQFPPTCWSPSPDQFFSDIAFVAGIILGFNSCMQRDFLGDTDSLISRIISQLVQCAYSLPADHPIQRAIHTLNSIVLAWHQGSSATCQSYGLVPPISYNGASSPADASPFLQPDDWNADALPNHPDAGCAPGYFVGETQARNTILMAPLGAGHVDPLTAVPLRHPPTCARAGGYFTY